MLGLHSGPLAVETYGCWGEASNISTSTDSLRRLPHGLLVPNLLPCLCYALVRANSIGSYDLVVILLTQSVLGRSVLCVKIVREILEAAEDIYVHRCVKGWIFQTSNELFHHFLM